MKRIFVFLFIFLMVFGSAVSAADISQNASIKKIQTLGIMEGYIENGEVEFMPDKKITRLEFVVALVNIMSQKKELVKETAKTPFLDIPEKLWASGYVAEALSLGIIDDEALNFYPDSELSYSDAARLLLDAMGYKSYAEAKGGYPLGYIIVADNLGINKGLELSESSALTRGQAAFLLSNAIDIKVLTANGIVDGDISYEVSKEDTILSLGRNIYMTEGIVEANEYTSLISSTINTAGEGRVKIGSDTYSVGDTSLSAELGSYVKLYYLKDKKQNTVIYYEKDMTQLRELEILSEDISDASKTSIKYYENDNLKEARLKSTAKIIYNGKYYCNLNAVKKEELMPLVGSLKLIDNNADNSYDLVIVHAPVTYIVADVFSSNGIITDKNGEDPIDTGDNAKSFNIYKDGELITIDSVRKGDVINAEISKDGKLYTLYVSSTAYTGSIDGTDDESVIVSGASYKLNKNRYPSGPYGIFIGKNATVRLDNYGYAADFEYADSQEPYGFIVGVGKNPGMDAVTSIKMFTSAKVFKVFECNKKLKIDGESFTKLEDIIDKLDNTGVSEASPSSPGVCQLVRYTTNDKGEITSIDTIDKKASEPDDSLTLFANDSYMDNETKKPLERSVMDSDTLTMFGDGTNFSKLEDGEMARFWIDASTVIFDIPDDKTKEDYFDIKQRAFFKYEGKYQVKGYDETSLGRANAIVISTGGASGAESIDFGTAGINFEIVTGFTKKLDADGMAVDVLKTRRGNSENEYVIKTDTGIYSVYNTERAKLTDVNYKETLKNFPLENGDGTKNINIGDIVHISADAKNVAENIYKAYPLESIKVNGSGNPVKEDGSEIDYTTTSNEKFEVRGLSKTIEDVMAEVAVIGGALDYSEDKTNKPYYIRKYNGWAERCFGRVIEKEGTAFMVETVNTTMGNSSKIMEIPYNATSASFTVYNVKTKTATAGSASDLIAAKDGGSHVFVRTRFGNVKEVFIFENWR